MAIYKEMCCFVPGCPGVLVEAICVGVETQDEKEQLIDFAGAAVHWSEDEYGNLQDVLSVHQDQVLPGYYLVKRYEWVPPTVFEKTSRV